MYYGGYGYGGIYFDWTWILLILGTVVCLIASGVMQSIAGKYA